MIHENWIVFPLETSCSQTESTEFVFGLGFAPYPSVNLRRWSRLKAVVICEIKMLCICFIFSCNDVTTALIG